MVAFQESRDAAIHRAVAERLKAPTELVVPHLASVIDEVGKSRLIITMRYHGAIAAPAAPSSDRVTRLFAQNGIAGRRGGRMGGRGRSDRCVLNCFRGGVCATASGTEPRGPGRPPVPARRQWSRTRRVSGHPLMMRVLRIVYVVVLGVAIVLARRHPVGRGGRAHRGRTVAYSSSSPFWHPSG